MAYQYVYKYSSSVVLSSNNFIVVGFVIGRARGLSFFGIGASRTVLLRRAKQKMLTQAKLINKSRAVIDEVVSIERSIFPFIRKVVVLGQVIEFISTESKNVEI